MLSVCCHPPPLAQDIARRMPRQWLTSSSLGSQYSAAGMRAVLPLQILINEIYSHLMLSYDMVEPEVHSLVVVSA